MVELKQIHYHLIGGLGDVSTTRKLPQLYSPELSSTIILSSLVDTYPSERLASRENISNLIDEIKLKKLKGNFDQNVATRLTNDLCDGKVRYFQFRDTEEFYKEFFDYVLSYDNSALDISTPNKTHLKFLEESIKRSQAHILVEKPIVLNRDHLKKLSVVLFSDIKNDYGRNVYNWLRENTEKNIHYIDGSTEADKRDFFKKKMETDENVILVASIGTFSEGIDILNLHNIYIVESSKSEIIVRQILGRGMRLMNGKDKITVFDFSDNFQYGSNQWQKKNYLLRHADERRKIYKEKNFPYKLFKVKL
jgi:superfamily II DNA or RNA helicase